MSEFSESYHLRSNDRYEGVALIKRAGLKGFVFPEANGWIPLVAEGYEFVPNDKLIEANRGILVHYVSAEDHGWYFSIYHSGKQVCHYECTWEEDILINDSELDMEVLIGQIKSNAAGGSIERKELEQMLYTESIDEILEEPSVTSRIASLLGLENYAWVSFYYADQDYFGDKEVYPDLICVDNHV